MLRNIYFPTLLVFSFCVQPLVAQQMSCCQMSATQKFAALGNDKQFADVHASPKISDYQGEGKMITFETPDGQQGNGFLLSAHVPTNKWVFIFHEWWGLNNNIKKEALKYYNDLEDVNVLAIDLYDGKVATDREQAQEYMQSAKDERLRNIIKGAISYAGNAADIATVGWCYGGSWSLQAAIMMEQQADGCVMFYGMPEDDMARLEKLRTPVLGIFAINDSWVSPEVVEQFQINMEKADKTLEVITFDANHAFANPSNENYNHVAAGKAYSAAIKFIRGNLNVAN